MRLASLLLPAAVASCLAAAPAPAARGDGGEGPDPIAVVEHIFAMSDRDGNGTLSRAEYTAANLERFGVTFDQCDANADGETTLSEYLDVYLRFHPSADRRKI